MKGILKLAPLFRIFRGQVEASELPLEKSVKTLAVASNLVVTKIRWLLPSKTQENPAYEDEEPADITGMVGATYVPAMEPWELQASTEQVEALLGDSARRYPRGATSLMGAPTTIVTSIDLRELREAMRLVAAKSEPVRRTLVIPKWNFVAHLRSFWSEVRRLAGKGVLLSFSRFLGKDKKEAIQNFLAFLELIKRRRVFARQTGPFGEIVFGTDQDRVSAMSHAEEEGREA
jgi:chromatin segregation and condensation protein Rec8/ScpA/Scc1 (kleisin family)